jgi:2-haloacid dehalogenase
MAAPVIKALIFDVFGSVVDWRASIIREGQAVGKRYGIETDWAAFADGWRGLYQPAMARIRNGERDFVKLDVLHRENMVEMLAKTGITKLDEAAIDDFNHAWHRLAPWPDSVEGLTRLKSKHIIATQSNGNVALMVNMAKNAGLPWDTILGAEVVGYYKPQPQAYIRACEMLDLPRDQVMMSAAHNDDLAAAKACGLRTAFFPRKDRGPDQTAGLTPEHDFDYVATDLIDLARQLGC